MPRAVGNVPLGNEVERRQQRRPDSRMNSAVERRQAPD